MLLPITWQHFDIIICINKFLFKIVFLIFWIGFKLALMLLFICEMIHSSSNLFSRALNGQLFIYTEVEKCTNNLNKEGVTTPLFIKNFGDRGS